MIDEVLAVVALGVPVVLLLWVTALARKVDRLESEIESAWDVLRGMNSALRSLSAALDKEAKLSAADDYPGTVEMNFIHKYGDPEP
ncbi:hypothetical protein QP363_10810 [Corynebacterium sp. UMB6689]|uniref:hypothetical protein n=1 Tax=Corynebacterium sp. UMB6689 TaxID=3046341 RepID=UPI00254ED625|nr:hypothetical protein [Corynebacterium sp. UMB6689]MDK6814478.1 hypothetical protein [Corynebacterium sp. UMB6689]